MLKPAITAFGLTLLALPFGAIYATECVAVAGKNYKPEEIYDARYQCGTCEGQRAKPLLCGAVNRMMVPYWSASADVVGIPERGYWGRPNHKNAPENTLVAAQQALEQGYRIIRFPVMLSGPDSSGKRELVVGRHTSMAAVGGSRAKRVDEYSAEELAKFRMRKRDQSLSFGTDENLLLFDNLIKWAASNQVLLLIAPNGRQARAAALEQARLNGALANIALIPDLQGYPATVRLLNEDLVHPYSDYEGQFLWNPGLNSTSTVSWHETEARIREWHASTNQSKQILSYQAYLYSNLHWSTSPLQGTDNRVYDNLIDVIAKLGPIGKRTSTWTMEAMGDRGWLYNDYTWNFRPGSIEDTRGNPWRNLSYVLSQHLAFISDRPEWYEAMTINPYRP